MVAVLEKVGLNEMSDDIQSLNYVPSPHAESAHLRDSHQFPGDISAVVPPDPIPNSEVKHSCADGSVAQAMQE